MIVYICYAISNILYVYSISVFLSSFMGKMRFGKSANIFYGLMYIADCIIYFAVTIPILFTITSMIMYYLLTLLYSKPKFKNIAATFIISIAIACSEGIASGIMSILNQIITDLNYDYVTVSVILISRLMFFIMSIIFRKLYHNKHQREHTIHNPGIYITPILSVFLLLLLVLFSNVYDQPLTTTGNILLIVPASLLVALNILVMYLEDRQNKILQLQKHNEILNTTINMQQKQYKSEDQIRTAFRKEKHDYKNFLVGIQSDLVSNNVSNALSKINEHIGTLSQTLISNSGCYALDSIVNFKGEQANSQGISIKTTYHIEDELTISADDLCILIGVALDNAIEYLSAHRKVAQSINIIANYAKNLLTLDISNHVADNICITDNSIPSTKGSSEHGYGLESAKLILKKYNGCLHLVCKNKLFHFGVSLCMEE